MLRGEVAAGELDRVLAALRKLVDPPHDAWPEVGPSRAPLAEVPFGTRDGPVIPGNRRTGAAVAPHLYYAIMHPLSAVPSVARHLPSVVRGT